MQCYSLLLAIPSYLTLIINAGNQREVIAVVKLISHTARNFPGVFYHGKPSAVSPIVARILPFFAQPLFRSLALSQLLALLLFSLLYSLLTPLSNFRSRHGVFFEALGSLLALLRSGARDAYRQFFVDSMSLIQGMKLRVNYSYELHVFVAVVRNYVSVLLCMMN